MGKALIVCGPTATGKTKFGTKLAQKLNGEIVSADSRQVYVGRSIICGKDLPANLKPQVSNLNWRNKYLKYYEVNSVKIWLYDVVEPEELFSVTLWKECAQIVIEDILSRQKLPIIVGGTGLYIKSLTHDLENISVPRNEKLRQELFSKDVDDLFNYLNRIDSSRAARLNFSDRQNPRRLIRAIELALAPPSLRVSEGWGVSYLQIGFTAPRNVLYKLVNQRVADRIAAGAVREDPGLAKDPSAWKSSEHAIVRHQLTWFKKQPHTYWFDITSPSWQIEAEKLATDWYNQ